jgi:hypothetical protein
LWKRQVSLDIADDAGQVRLTFSKHRIDFEYQSSIGWANDRCIISIYNLSEDEIKALQSRKSGFLSCTIKAGYKDTTGLVDYLTNSDAPTQTICVGTITNALSCKIPPDNITKLYIIPENVYKWTKVDINYGIRVNSLITPGDTLERVFQNLGIQVGMSFRYFGIPDEILKYKFNRGRSFHKTLVDELQNLCEEFNLTFCLRPNFVEIYPSNVGSIPSIRDILKDTKTIEITPRMVIGQPVATVSQIALSLNLNASIQSGMIIDVSKLIDPTGSKVGLGYMQYNDGWDLTIDATRVALGLSNTYQIQTLVHHGSTHAPEFQTDIAGVYGVGNSMDLTSDFKDWYSDAFQAENYMHQPGSAW